MFNRKEYMKEYNKKYREEHCEEIKKWHKKYRKEHLVQERESKREYRKKHLEKVREWEKKSHKLHPEKDRERSKRWGREHREQERLRSIKRRSTPKGRMDNRISAAICRALKGNKAGRSWEFMVEYTLDQLKKHLQELFTNGMTWEKFMAGEIHIDHIVPKSHFKYDSPEDPQFKECWAIYNLKPLWAKDNMSKGDRNYQLPLVLTS